MKGYTTEILAQEDELEPTFQANEEPLLTVVGTGKLSLKPDQNFKPKKQVGTVRFLGFGEKTLEDPSWSKALVSEPGPSWVAKGDSGGPLFGKDKKGKEKIFALNIALTDSEEGHRVFVHVPIAPHRKWIMEKLEKMGCL